MLGNRLLTRGTSNVSSGPIRPSSDLLSTPGPHGPNHQVAHQHLRYYLSGLDNFSEQFAASAARFPDRPAVSVIRDPQSAKHDPGSAVRDAECLTYRELDGLSARAAAFLAASGIRKGDRCAILAENSAPWCAAYLGILRIGAIAVPFDASYQREQVATLLRDSGAAFLFASTRLERVARAAADRTVCRVASIEQAQVPPPDVLPPSPARRGDPAVILYTSGTTADPKGVVLTHANLLAEKDGVLTIAEVDERDAILGVLPLSDPLAQMANLLLPFSVGAHVVLLEMRSTRDLLRALHDGGITIVVGAPQFFSLIHQRIFDDVEKRGRAARALFRGLLRLNGRARRLGINAGPSLFGRVHRTLGPRIRLLVTGGSKFDEAVGRDLYDVGFTVLQAYGLAETSGAATVTRPGEPIRTVGRPFRTVEIAVDRPAPGAAWEEPDGEILIRGPIVMAGYWNRPDATAAVLRDGWLRTGDLGHIDARGCLTITGRRNEVIVLGSGTNIHPEEVEAHYRQSAFIRELCVMGAAAAGEPSAERLHAIVVPDPDVLRERKIVNTTELIRFELEGLSIALPPYRRVLGFEIGREPLPRTTTGKLKRHEILRRYREGARVTQPPAASAAAVDEHVARIAAIVRRCARPDAAVSADSNLELDLGFDSMERVELIARLETRFSTRVPEVAAQAIFTVRDLAEVFRGASESAADGEGLPWASLLDVPDPRPELRALLKPRPIAAPVLFVLVRTFVALFIRPRAGGLENLPRQGPFVISPNHQGYLDPLVLLGVLPFGVFRQLFFVGAAEYFETPLSARLAGSLNVVPVDPDANLVPAMQASAFGLRHGRVLVLFPEGERSIDGTVKKFKKGAAILSHHLQVPIVPVAIAGSFDLWPRNRPFAWRRLLPWSGHRVRVQFGRPLPPGSAAYAEQTARLRARVEKMWLVLTGQAGGSSRSHHERRGDHEEARDAKTGPPV